MRLLTRRTFATTAAAPLLGQTRSANGRISLGLIGAGGRGNDLMGELEKCRDYNIALRGLCDVWKPNREKAAARITKAWGEAPWQTTRYEELLARKDIDAVLIAAPDFAHSPMLEAAVKAGKDVYCEKPMGVEIDRARSAYLAVKKSDRVVQIGTQRRSDGKFIAAAKLVQSGVLGQITRVDISMNFQQPRWRRKVDDVRAEDVDWTAFRMHRPDRPFDPRHLREWQLFRDYTNGIAGLWMCHFIDTIQWFTGDPYPANAVTNGGVYLWKDGRDTSDVFHTLLEYPKGFLVSFAMSLTNEAGTRNLWFGTKGTLDADAFVLTGKGSTRPDRIEGERRVEPEAVNSHMANFLECIRSRQKPRADIEAGFSHAVACCMSAAAHETGRKVRFDRNKLEIV